MTTDLEQRRLAIAEALRAIMAEPLPEHQQPTGTTDQLAGPEPAAATAPAVEDTPPSGEWNDDEWDDEDFEPLEDAMVPPLESVGTMSRMASLALFGHA
jgi:hypothetical protein